MRAILHNWPRLVFIFLPLSIVAVDAAVMINERLQPETEKAIRLVKESTSRKENFTVQQYLYMTVYHRRNRGEPVEIEGWHAVRPAEPDSSVTVEFSYRDADGRHSAVWEVSVGDKRITEQTDLAKDISWH